MGVMVSLSNHSGQALRSILRRAQDDTFSFSLDLASHFTNPVGMPSAFKIGSQKHFDYLFSLIKRNKPCRDAYDVSIVMLPRQRCQFGVPAYSRAYALVFVGCYG